MADFTEAERAYIALFEHVKRTLPDAYCSIKKLTIVDRQSLMKSFLLFFSPTYNTGSYIFYGDMLLEEGRINLYRSLNSKTILLNMKGKTKKQLEDETSAFIEKIMRYLPRLPLTLAPDTSFLQSPENIQQTAEFLRHLEINRSLLLQGPPHANDHAIDPVRAAEWVRAQRTPERQRLAQILLDNIRYIPHKQILHALQHCVYKLKKQLEEEGRLEMPIILITGRVYKSNYYIALLFAHYWLKAGMRIDCVYDTYFPESIHATGTVLDVDDMAYSGNQTRNDLVSTTRRIYNTIRNTLIDQLRDNTDFQETYMLIPRLAMESMLNSAGFRYFMIRAFMSEAGFKEITKDSTVCMPIQVITYKKIPYMPGVSEEDKRKIEILFNRDAATTVYLDHKVADTPSTFLLPLAVGIVPDRPLIGNIQADLNAAPQTNFNEIQGDGVSFLPFIRHCGPTERPLPVNRQNIFRSGDLRDELRCPYAWYKLIDYETGTYPKVPLPYGPTETNFAGGERSRPNCKTKKQKRRVKQKTRSHSK